MTIITENNIREIAKETLNELSISQKNRNEKKCKRFFSKK